VAAEAIRVGLEFLSDIAGEFTRGVVIGGLRDNGLELQREAEERAEALRPVFAELAGLSHRAAAKSLNERGIKTATGKDAVSKRPRNPYTSKPKEWPDGPNKEFLKNLMRPGNGKHPYRDKDSLSCCDAGDTVKTTFKVEMGDGLHMPVRACLTGISGGPL
jgi:hypothetical protein